mmetsp:Transcript_9461/g.10986  ORF Transcript_9461/g.10986 Transcript_9461/m.10986 type:complete len:136 (+) Transcript_9461:163-570(+)
MVFNNDLSIDSKHQHTPHTDTDTDTDTNTDADEIATLLGGRGNDTSISAFCVSRFRLVGFVVLSLSAFVFLLNQGTSISLSSSVAVINSNNNEADMIDDDIKEMDRDWLRMDRIYTKNDKRGTIVIVKSISTKEN